MTIFIEIMQVGFIQYFCFIDRPIKVGDILDVYKGGNLRKEGVGLEKEGV